MSDNKREYYRINHPVVIEYRNVAPDEINDPDLQHQFSQTKHGFLHTELAELDSQIQHLEARIGQSNSLVLHYLQLLDQKIDLIAATVTEPEMTLLPASDKQTVNLSQGGIRFRVGTPVTVNTLLALRIVLPQSHVELPLYAKVLRCLLDKPSNQYELACEFLNMPERYRALLARFVLEVEAKQRKASKEDD